jgi:halimadienyl-diphosphate synthase
MGKNPVASLKRPVFTRRVAVNFRQEARDLVLNLNQRMSPSPYDIAWLARLRKGDQPRWPHLVQWLIDNQYSDGSWGAEVVYYHDRIISTLAAAIALHVNGKDETTRKAVKRAERYLWSHVHLLHRDPFELVGFELIFPILLAEAHALGLDTPTHACGYDQIQLAKLRLIPPDMLYSPKITTIHSLEFLGRSGDLEQLRRAVGPNGSIGNSPAATAYYLSLDGQDERAIQYLEMVEKKLGHINILYPFRIFELTWALNNLDYSGVPITEFADESIWKDLQQQLTEDGIGLDPSFGIPDGDITSVTSRLLTDAGYKVDPMILAKYENKEKRLFRTYHFERNMSVGTNIHALEALQAMKNYPNRVEVQDQIAVAILDKRIFNIYWLDKWHASPYYATSHVLIGFLREGGYLIPTCRPSVDWILHTQREDGSWGFYEDGTAEETAYAMTALLHYHRYEPVDVEVLHRGADYLARTYKSADSTYPALWIDKSLYVPYDVVRAAVLAALIMYEETFKRQVEVTPVVSLQKMPV